MFDYVCLQFVLEGKTVIALSGTEHTGLTEHFVGNALDGGNSLSLNVFYGFVNVIESRIVADFIDSFDTLDEMLA